MSMGNEQGIQGMMSSTLMKLVSIGIPIWKVSSFTLRKILLYALKLVKRD